MKDIPSLNTNSENILRKIPSMESTSRNKKIVTSTSIARDMEDYQPHFGIFKYKLT